MNFCLKKLRLKITKNSKKSSKQGLKKKKKLETITKLEQKIFFFNFKFNFFILLYYAIFFNYFTSIIY